MSKSILGAALALLLGAGAAHAGSASTVLTTNYPASGPALLFSENAALPSDETSPPPFQYGGGSQACVNSANDTQCTWTFPHAIPAGSTVVGFIHASDDTDQYPGYADYVTFGTTRMMLSSSVEWYPYPEPISLFYLVNVPGGVTTITADYGTTMKPGTTTGNDFDITVYSGAHSVVVTNPTLVTSSSPTVSTTVSPTLPALLWGFSSPNTGNPTGTGPSGYELILDDMQTDGIALWQSPGIVAAGTYTLTFSNYPGYDTACNGPLGDPNPCPIVLMGAAVQNGASPP